MANATPQQIEELEILHKNQFIELVKALNLYWGYQLKQDNLTSDEIDTMVALGNQINSTWNDWIRRQRELESESETIMPFPDLDIFEPGNLPLLRQFSEYYLTGENPPNIGLPIIPVLWAIAALAGLFTVGYVVDEISTSASEQEALLRQVDLTCHNLKLSERECLKLMEGAKPSSELSGLFNLAGLAIGAYLLTKIL